jgi:uncharacterized protein (DUF2126 family)
VGAKEGMAHWSRHMWTVEEFEAAVRHHDAQIAALGLTIWVGSEPTFTDCTAQTPEWLSQALGGDKERRAEAVLGGVYRRFPGGLMLRTVGRQYPGEERPRWCLALYRRRDGMAIWHGPPDPIQAVPGSETLPDLDTWTASLSAALVARGYQVSPVTADDAVERRLLMRADADVAAPDATDRRRLARPSVHAQATPAGGLRDELAESGAYLFVLRMKEPDGRSTARIELPQFTSVSMFLAVLHGVEQACLACQLPALILAGYPPPADDTVELTTVTPDPAVVEINTAPSVSTPPRVSMPKAFCGEAAKSMPRPRIRASLRTGCISTVRWRTLAAAARSPWAVRRHRPALS